MTSQVDLFNLIGGSWPPAPLEPGTPEYGSVPRGSRTMQRERTERVKSVNLLAHLAPDRRRKHTTAHGQGTLERTKGKMVHEPKNIDTGILVGEKCCISPITFTLHFRYSMYTLQFIGIVACFV